MVRLTKKLLFAIEAVLDIAYNGSAAPVHVVRRRWIRWVAPPPESEATPLAHPPQFGQPGKSCDKVGDPQHAIRSPFGTIVLTDRQTRMFSPSEVPEWTASLT